jgi:broad specificity phosphatase PhoE
MIISFIRHGESMSNKGLVLASAEDSKNDITNFGVDQIKRAANSLRDSVDGIYVSPYLRTKSSAQIFIENRKENLTPIVDYRLQEIDYGIYVDQKDHPMMGEVANKQINGDYEVRFGETGENKREILTRFYSFLTDLIDIHGPDEHIVIFSHGRAISMVVEALSKAGLKPSKNINLHTDNGSIKRIEIRTGDRAFIIDAQKEINKSEAKKRQELVQGRFKYLDNIDHGLQDVYLRNYLKIAEEGIGNVELSNDILDAITDGFYVSKIDHVCNTIDVSTLDKDVVVVCVMRNAEKVLNLFLKHYEKIGIKNFVFIDNNSDDNTLSILEKYRTTTDISIDVWSTKETFDSFRSCGWRQRMFAYYGMNRWYLDLDIDELFVYPGIEKNGIRGMISYANKKNLNAVGSVMIDMYSSESVFDLVDVENSDIQNTYSYLDKGTYFKDSNIDYGFRVYGGPRRRKFGISPWLQKFPLVYIDEMIMNTNPHFWYPFPVNNNVPFISALLHYKFLPGDFEQYIKYAKSGVHWNNSKEYKKYVEVIGSDEDFTFFDADVSVKYNNSDSLSLAGIIDRMK